MKRSDFIDGLMQVLYDSERCDTHDINMVMDYIEAHLTPKSYINPKAWAEFGDIIKKEGRTWGYIHYIDKYPEHHFPRGRPYEFYLEGWEDET